MFFAYLLACTFFLLTYLELGGFLDRGNSILLILAWGRALLVGSGLDSGKKIGNWLGVGPVLCLFCYTRREERMKSRKMISSVPADGLVRCGSVLF